MLCVCRCVVGLGWFTTGMGGVGGMVKPPFSPHTLDCSMNLLLVEHRSVMVVLLESTFGFLGLVRRACGGRCISEHRIAVVFLREVLLY